ncbi:hypothetical protein X797_009622 [Metarhizium robertsii]|uniref:Uncharacterized protein n=1 Tax=Metarhizium robertsii TaxID=568076 RepID=A0A014QUR9_9HYPO|nr:hypothetical protein X797_009622 [Metarhizium robertsii]
MLPTFISIELSVSRLDWQHYDIDTMLGFCPYGGIQLLAPLDTSFVHHISAYGRCSASPIDFPRDNKMFPIPCASHQASWRSDRAGTTHYAPQLRVITACFPAHRSGTEGASAKIHNIECKHVLFG